MNVCMYVCMYANKKVIPRGTVQRFITYVGKRPTQGRAGRPLCRKKVHFGHEQWLNT
jgi:hypothetical protein